MALHGGPVSALLAHVAEAARTLVPMQPARFTVELLRPVPPHRPLIASAKVLRDGKKVQLVEASLRSDTVELARARLLRIRTETLEFPSSAPIETEQPFDRPDELSDQGHDYDDNAYTAFHNSACVHRFASGKWAEPGPAEVWVKLVVPLLAGRTPSPLERVAAAADFGNGISAVLPPQGWSFINADLTIHLNRPLQGDWVGMRTKSHLDASGVGFAESELFDTSSRIGRSVQSLLVEDLARN
jgi:acyl-CoA thioesterase